MEELYLNTGIKLILVKLYRDAKKMKDFRKVSFDNDLLGSFSETLVHNGTFLFKSGALAKTESMSDLKSIVTNAKLLVWLIEFF